MKTSSTQKIKTGIFILLGLAILFIFTFVIGNQRNMFSNTFSVNGIFKNVAGLKPGSYVRFAGINVGTVEDVTIMNDTSVKVELSLENDVKKFIKPDSKLSIGSDGLMGDKLITISAGSYATVAGGVKNGQQLQTMNPMEMDQIMTRISSITEGADVLVGNLAEISDHITSGEGSIGRLLMNDKMAKNMEATLISTQKTVTTVNKAAGGLADNMEAAKNSFILRGFFKKKERKRIKDSIANAKKLAAKQEQE